MAVALPATAAERQLADRPHLRRCTYRRLIRIAVGPDSLYDVECLYPDRRASIPLGDLEIARPICNSCRAANVFRPDEE